MLQIIEDPSCGMLVSSVRREHTAFSMRENAGEHSFFFLFVLHKGAASACPENLEKIQSSYLLCGLLCSFVCA